MKLRSVNRIRSFIGIAIVLAYMSIGVFGLFQMNDHKFMAPTNDCPYALNSHALCDNGLSHINNWREFSNVVFPTLLTLSIILTIIFFAEALNFFDRNKFLRQKLCLFYKWTQYLDDKFSHISKAKIVRWLSFFENSPSVNVVYI